jgi:heptosyltransferase-2
MLKILIIAPSWVGDAVMAQSLLITLKYTYPDSQIDVLAPEWSQALFSRMPQVNQTLIMPLTHGEFDLKKRLTLGKQCQKNNYTQAIVLPNSWKSALIPFFAKIPKRTGYIGECRFGLLNDTRKLNKSRLPTMVQRFVALGSHSENDPCPSIPFPELSISALQQNQVIEQFSLCLDKPVLALCIGAEYGSAKCWPESHFAKLAILQLEKKWQVWLIGSSKDQRIAEDINKICDFQCQNFTGKTTLEQAIDLLSFAKSVVSNDSGLLHVAAALKKPVIALYGSSDPTFTPPLSTCAHIISLNLPCSPCFKRECPLGHRACLTDISSEFVAQYIA